MAKKSKISKKVSTPKGRDPIVPVRTPTARKAVWQKAADLEGVSLSEFLRLAADERAARVRKAAGR